MEMDTPVPSPLFFLFWKEFEISVTKRLELLGKGL